METRQEVIARAQKMLREPERYVLWDTETTGLCKKSQIIEIAAINCAGQIMCNTRLRPSVRINPQAYDVHGISEESLQGAATWKEFHREWESIAKNACLVAYNLSFDARLIAQTYDAFGISKPPMKGLCAMKMSTIYDGERSKLKGNHSAIGDCVSLLDRIIRWATQEQSERNFQIPDMAALRSLYATNLTLPFQ